MYDEVYVFDELFFFMTFCLMHLLYVIVGLW